MTRNFNLFAQYLRLYNDTLEEIGNTDPGLATRVAAAELGFEDTYGNKKEDIALHKAKAVLTYAAVTNFEQGEHAIYHWAKDKAARKRYPDMKYDSDAVRVRVVETNKTQRHLWHKEGDKGNAYAFWLNARAAGIQHFDAVQSKFPANRLIEVEFGNGITRKVDIFFLRKQYFSAQCSDVIVDKTTDENGNETITSRDPDERERQIIGHSGSPNFSACDRVINVEKNDGTIESMIDPNMNWENFHMSISPKLYRNAMPVTVTSDSNETKKFNDMTAADLAKNIPFLSRSLELMQEQAMAVTRAGGMDWTKVPSTEIMDANRRSNNRAVATGYLAHKIGAAAAEESFDVESLSGGESLSFMSTEGGSQSDVSLFSTEGSLVGGGDVSLFSTEGSLEGGDDVSLFSTEGSLVGGGDVSLFSTEGSLVGGGDVSLFSTEGSLSLDGVSLMSTEVPRAELDASVLSESLSGGDASESVDVDALYEEYMNTMDDGSSVSHIE